MHLKKLVALAVAVCTMTSTIFAAGPTVQAEAYEIESETDEIASDYEVSGDWTYSITNDGARITKYSGADATVQIPSKLGGKNVVELYGGVFARNRFVQTVIIPDTVTKIGYEVFENCEELREIKGAINVSSIGSSAFYNSNKFTIYPFSDSLKSIDHQAFYNTNITNVYLPKNIEVDGYAFGYCNNITSITIPDGAKIGNSAFAYCKSLTSAKIGNAQLSYSIFEYDTALTRVEITEGINAIPESCFYQCENLTTVNIPTSVRTIGSSAFSNCKSLTSITIPYGVLNINGYAFCYTGLKNVVIPNSVVSIGYDVFYSAPLSSIRIPRSVTEIRELVAYGERYGLTVECYKDSKADTFAQGEKHKIVYLSDSPRATNLSLSRTEVVMMSGETAVVGFSTTPSGNTDAVVWESVDTNIATVNGMGEITARRVGTTTLVAETTNGIRRTVKVNVTSAPSSIRFSKSSVRLLKGNSTTNAATVYGQDGNKMTNMTVSYRSSNTNVVTVDNNGKIKAVGAGTATITGALDRFGISSSYTVTVLATPAKPTISVSSPKSKQLKVRWNKAEFAQGYELQYSTSSSFKSKKTAKITNKNAVSKTINKLKPGKKYYVRVRSYATVNGKKVYSKWSTKKSIKVRK